MKTIIFRNLRGVVRFSLAAFFATTLAAPVIAQPTSNADWNIDSVTWDVVGLDSNDPAGIDQNGQPAGSGPNRFMIGARITNTTNPPVTLTDISASFNWDPNPVDPVSGVNVASNFVLENPVPITIDELAPGADIDVYWNVNVIPPQGNVQTRKNIFDRGRIYQIVVDSPDTTSIGTPDYYRLVAENLVSQNRNDILSITGPTSVFVGQTYEYVLDAQTATQGYEQLVATIDFPNTLFQIRDIQTFYTAPAGATHDEVYADACGWDRRPFLPVTSTTTNTNYLSCVGSPDFPPLYAGEDKAGGTIRSIYQVEIIDTTAPNITVIPVIYDFSGNSFHYNTDFGGTANIITIQNINADIGGRVYRDTIEDTQAFTGNGIYEPITPKLESGFSGVTVNLSQEFTTGVVPIATTTTDADGLYAFDGLTTGTYLVNVDGSTGGLQGNEVVSGTMDHRVSLGSATKMLDNITNLDVGLNSSPDFAAIDDFTVDYDENSNSFIINWVTSEEIANLGFNIFHATKDSVGNWAAGMQANDKLILSEAGEFGNGASYTYTVPSAAKSGKIALAGFYLQDVDTSGKTTFHGPAFWSIKDATVETWDQYQ